MSSLQTSASVKLPLSNRTFEAAFSCAADGLERLILAEAGWIVRAHDRHGVMLVLRVPIGERVVRAFCVPLAGCRSWERN